MRRFILIILFGLFTNSSFSCDSKWLKNQVYIILNKFKQVNTEEFVNDMEALKKQCPDMSLNQNLSFENSYMFGFYMRNKLKEANEHAKNCLEIILEKKSLIDTNVLSQFYFDLSALRFYEGNTKNAIDLLAISEHYDKSIISMKRSFRLKIGNAHNIGSIINIDSMVNFYMKRFYEKSSDFEKVTIKSSVGEYYRISGFDEKAKKYFLEAIKIKEETNEGNISQSLIKLANIYQNSGQYKSAIACIKEIKTLAPKNNLNDMYLGLGDIFNVMKENDSAIYYYSLLTNTNKKTPITYWTYSKIGRIYTNIGKYDSAKYYINKSMSFFSKYKNTDNYIEILKKKQILHLATKEYLKMDSLYSDFIKTYPNSKIITKTHILYPVYSYQYEALLDRGKYYEAKKVLDVLLTGIDSNITELDFENPIYLFDIMNKKKLNKRIISHLLFGYMLAYEKLDKKTISQNFFDKLKQVYQHSDINYNVIRLHFNANSQRTTNNEIGFEMLDILKSKKYIQEIRSDKICHLNEDLCSNINNLKKIDSKNNLSFEEIKDKETILNRIKKKHPKYNKYIYESELIKFSEISNFLNRNEVCIQYFFGKKNSFTILIFDKKEIKKFQIDIDDTYNLNIDKFRKTTSNYTYITKNPKQAWEEYTRSATYLYDKLFPAKARELLKGKSHIYVIPDGELNYLSFEALLKEKPKTTERDYKKLGYLINDFDISYAYSATLLFKTKDFRTPTKQKLLTYGGFAPEYDKELLAKAEELEGFRNFRSNPSALANNKNEISSIAKLFKGDEYFSLQANEKNFKENAGKYKILHLAMHALTDDEDPLYSKFLFTNKKGDSIEDNYLNAYELYNMELNADLAVLSACNTGYGKIVRGEGAMSLARAFKYAGCPSIVMSLWQADDEATSSVMIDFFKNLQQSNTKSVSLRDAKLSYLNQADNITAHPYFWSNFVVLGDNSPVETKTTNWWMFILYGIGGFALLLISLKFVKKNKTT